MGYEHEDSLGLRVLCGGLAKEIFQNRNLRQPRNSSQALALQILQHSAHQVGFTLAQADHVFDLLLTNDRLCDAADIGLTRHRRNVHGDFKRHIAVGVDVRRDVDIYANIVVLKLGINQGVDANPANAGLK